MRRKQVKPLFVGDTFTVKLNGGVKRYRVTGIDIMRQRMLKIKLLQRKYN